MDVFDIVQDSVDYLKNTDNILWEFFLNSSITEEMIPDTYKAIKKYVLKFYNNLNSSNNSIRLIKTPLLKMSSSIIDTHSIEPLLNYFKYEKECLINIKKFLNSNYDLPLASYTGIFTATVVGIHAENDDKLNRIIEIAKSAKNSAFGVQIPNECLNPVNTELLCNINTTLNKTLIKK